MPVTGNCCLIVQVLNVTPDFRGLEPPSDCAVQMTTDPPWTKLENDRHRVVQRPQSV